MDTKTWIVSFATLVAISLVYARRLPAQESRTAEEPAAHAIPLTVPAGVPLHAALDKTVPVKNAGIAVEGRVVEPVYVFDHLVIPAGSQLLGRVTRVDNASRKRRALAIANGNFSPLRRLTLISIPWCLKTERGFPCK